MIPIGPPPSSSLPPTEELVGSRVQEFQRDSTTPLPMFYIVVSIIIILFLIVVILGVDVFHFW